ncbi:uncharacterized protein LOC116435077 [Nomia melanderi]|uniref:uncharacterized protein LOC116435077 n=1 Tax=Nomia melanderi TaxID=2448451 RepID=UPI0013043594|nr:uncharacterized protein LOC116435077 [Nomia melanderi]
MTLKSLMNFGNLGKDHRPPVERYQGASRGYHHSGSGGWYRGNSKGKGGTGAALSALTLLAFLFLINVMQQSLQDTNSTMPTMSPTMFVVREGELPIIVDAKEEKEVKRQDDVHKTQAKSKIQRLNNQYIK